ncbi:MAG: hypothetical protein HKN71_08090 [Gemmatimonadetes bacterium]|nr:hypothetical protein [Gemmatimonadota bacterium]
MVPSSLQVAARARDLCPGLALLVVLLAAVTGGASPGHAQIQRHPTGVNVDAMGATTVFITFGNLEGYVPAEALWCGELIPASPDIGEKCDRGTLFGSLPLRFAQGRPSGQQGFTDIMSIPPSVARRAYQAALDGDESSFFYVRRFVDPQGIRPDQFVSVTCRMAGGGARVPLALLDVRLGFATDGAVLAVAAGDVPPPLQAEIRYNGTGALVGRWEVVMPGEDPPTAADLLTEATLPVELRGTQRRYTELERFNVFLPPTGEIVLPGPDVRTLPTDRSGMYQVLLRIEASDDKEGDSDLAAAGAGAGVVPAGAVAGFPIPPLRYFVGGAGTVGVSGARLRALFPAADSLVTGGEPVTFTWTPVAAALLYRVEVRGGDGARVLAALLRPGSAMYRAPDWLQERAGADVVEWRVQALGVGGAVASETPWRTLRLER